MMMRFSLAAGAISVLVFTRSANGSTACESKLFASDRAFAVLHGDGSLYAWGAGGGGGNIGAFVDERIGDVFETSDQLFAVSETKEKLFSKNFPISDSAKWKKVVIGGGSEFALKEDGVANFLGYRRDTFYDVSDIFATDDTVGVLVNNDKKKLATVLYASSSQEVFGVKDMRAIREKNQYFMLKTDSTVVNAMDEVLLTGINSIVASNDCAVVFSHNDGTLVSLPESGCIQGLPSRCDEIITGRGLFGCNNDNGEAFAWGDGLRLVDKHIKKVAKNDLGVLYLFKDGTVTGWGADTDGLYEDMAATKDAFALVDREGNVKTWAEFGSVLPSHLFPNDVPVKKFLTTATGSSCILFEDGTVVTDEGGTRKVNGNFKDIAATNSAFAALGVDGSVVAWGNPEKGGSTSGVSVSSGVTSITASYGIFAATKATSVVFWGSMGPTVKDISGRSLASISVSRPSFALLFTDGKVECVGLQGEQTSSCDVSGVQSVVGARFAFAALKTDGTVETWGSSDWGGDSSTVASDLVNVEEIVRTESAFAARRRDGKAILWGSSLSTSVPSGDLSSGVSRVFGGDRTYGFAALKSDSSLVLTGDLKYGESGGIDLSGEFEDVFFTNSATAALKKDRSLDFKGWYASGSIDGKVSKVVPSREDGFGVLLESGELILTKRGSQRTFPRSNNFTDILGSQRGIYAKRDDGTYLSWGEVLSTNPVLVCTPTRQPTSQPTKVPSQRLTFSPSQSPSMAPSKNPSQSPSRRPPVSSSQSDDSDLVLIAGVAGGSLAFLGVLAAIIIGMKWKRQRQKRTTDILVAEAL